MGGLLIKGASGRRGTLALIFKYPKGWRSIHKVLKISKINKNTLLISKGLSALIGPYFICILTYYSEIKEKSEFPMSFLFDPDYHLLDLLSIY